MPAAPRFYALSTADGIPYSKIALLHARRVLASTVLQSCVRYNDRARACQFCAIGTSLKEGRTLARKTPAQLAEVAEAAVRLDGVEQMVMTTGTPATADRGAAHLAACAAAVKAAVPALPIQVQCEPPDDFVWFARLRAAGADALGMHLEAVEPAVRAAVMPGKAEVPIERYLDAFAAAVAVFGRGQVSTYLIAGPRRSAGEPARDGGAAVRDRRLSVRRAVRADRRHADGRHAPPPSATHARACTRGRAPAPRAGLSSAEMKAGCAKCGACSALSTYEAASCADAFETAGVAARRRTARRAARVLRAAPGDLLRRAAAVRRRRSRRLRRERAIPIVCIAPPATEPARGRRGAHLGGGAGRLVGRAARRRS